MKFKENLERLKLLLMEFEMTKKGEKKYSKPVLKSEKILDAGLGATRNGTIDSGRKSVTLACNAGSLKT